MSYIISTSELKDFTHTFKQFFIINTDINIEIYTTSSDFLLVEGFVFDMNLNKKLNSKEIVEIVQSCINKKETFPDNITGQYNIIYMTENSINIINDFIGMKPLYYHLGNKVFLSNNIYKFGDYDFEIDEMGFYQSMIRNLYNPLNARTLFKNVLFLRGGEYILYNCSTSSSINLIDKMEMTNAKINKKEVSEFVELLKNNATIYKSIFEKIVLPISGGVDSRITLCAFGEFNSNFHAVSYGEPDYIDNKIAKNLSKFIGISHDNISFKDHLFPTNEEFDQMITNGGEYITSSWFSVIKELKTRSEFDNSVVLIGDLLDTLRSKNLKSLRSRKQRLTYQLKRIIGFEIQMEALDLESFVTRHTNIYRSRVQALKESHPHLFTKYNFNEENFMSQTSQDLQNFVEFINLKFSPKNQANLEEAFYVSTWGSRTMAKQANIFKGNYQSFSLMASRHVVKHNLQFSPLEKFEDKLTHKLLCTKGFNGLSHFPTAQIPFISYKRNIYLKYTVWALRSTIDQLLIKMGKGRLVKHIEWAQYYKNENNELLLKKLLADVDEEFSKIPFDIFAKRASGETWPLSETDINVFCFLLKFRNLKSSPKNSNS